MRVVVQRVQNAQVTVGDRTIGEIAQGMLLLVGFQEEDSDRELEWMANKLIKLRIFDDENGVMNRSIVDIQGDILCVSQFTLYANPYRGNRPSYIESAPSHIAKPLYDRFLKILAEVSDLPVERGEFGANMQVDLRNDGPVTILLDTAVK